MIFLIECLFIVLSLFALSAIIWSVRHVFLFKKTFRHYQCLRSNEKYRHFVTKSIWFHYLIELFLVMFIAFSIGVVYYI